MIKILEGGKYCIAIQLCCGSPDDGDYIIVRWFKTKEDRDQAFDNVGRDGL
jgi:hypothetical protein